MFRKNLAVDVTKGELTDEQLSHVAGGSLSGINALIAVTQMKAANANQDALDGAESQRQLQQQPLFSVLKRKP